MKTMKLEAPNFLNEKEEADWWFAHRDQVEADMMAAMDAGEAPAIDYELQSADRLCIPPEDAALAKEQAARNGVPFEEYARRLFHEALQAEKTRRASW